MVVTENTEYEELVHGRKLALLNQMKRTDLREPSDIDEVNTHKRKPRSQYSEEEGMNDILFEGLLSIDGLGRAIFRKARMTYSSKSD